MNNYSIMETTYYLMVTMAALIFNLMLYFMQCILVAEQEKGNHRFRRFTFLVMLGNLMTIACYYTRYSVLFWEVPRAVSFLIYLASLVSNILLTYAFSRYIGGFIGEDALASRHVLTKINFGICFAAILLAAVVYFWRVPALESSLEQNRIPEWMQYTFGFGVELYFLIYTLLIFFIFGRKMNRRAIVTVAAAFTLTIAGIVAEFFNSSHILFNYFGVTLGLYLFYFGTETPDYKKLMLTMHQLEDATARAENANQSKSDFLANMSHEIRTPINAVIGMNEMILRESTDPQIKAYAKDVDSAGKNLLAIINDILDFSKIEAGKMEIVEAPYRLSSVINDVAVMTSFRAQAKGLKFEVDVDESLPDQLNGDEVRIRRVIANILNNAVKYTHEGGIVFSVHGKYKTMQLVLEIAVTDTGIGIREEDMPRLFKRFDRLDMGQNKTVEGTGLGLAITASLVAMMGGSVGVESKYGEGSTFTILLPQRIVSKEPIGNYREKFERSIRENSRYRETFRAPDAKILVVDDTIVNLTVVKSLLKKTQIAIDVASGGMEALDMTQNTKYDLIFMDQRMPRMNGTQALQRIRAQVGGANTETPVICLTADAVAGARERYISEGFTDYLTKPIEGSEIEKMLINYLDESKIRRVEEEHMKEAADDRKDATEQEKPTLKQLYEKHDVLSYQEAMENTLNEEILMEVLADYTQTITENADEIADYLAKDDIENYTIKVHALKSSSRLIGAMKLSEHAKELEACGNAVKDGDTDAMERIRKETGDLLNDYRALLGVFGALFEKPDENGTKEEMDADALRELYESLDECAQVYDLNTLDLLIRQAEQYEIPEAEKERFSRLKKAVTDSDWEEIKRLAEEA